MTRDIESSARLQLMPLVCCHVEIYTERSDMAKVVMGSKRNGITFSWGIKLHNTPVQRCKVHSLCHIYSDYALVFFL